MELVKGRDYELQRLGVYLRNEYEQNNIEITRSRDRQVYFVYNQVYKLFCASTSTKTTHSHS